MRNTLERLHKLVIAVFGAIVICSLGSGWTGRPSAAFAQSITDLERGAYLVTYFDVSASFTRSQQGYGGPGNSGGNGDALVHVVDVGNFNGPPNGDLCINLYVFDDDQEMEECCSCPTSADEVGTLSTINELTSNPQFSSPLGLGVIKIVGSNPAATCVSGGDGVAGTAGTLTASELAEGLDAWINHTESIATNNASFKPPYGFITTTSVQSFHHAPIDSGELNRLTTLCSAIELHASGRGICSCGLLPTPPPPPVSGECPTGSAACVNLCPATSGSPGNYAVLAGASVTNVPPTTIIGNLGISPGSTLTGAPLVTGVTDLGNANSLNGQNILTAAITDANSRTPTDIPADLGGQILNGGVYTTLSGAFTMSTDLTLNAQGDPSTVWIFLAASSLTTTTGNVVLENGALGCNVFWVLGSSATLGTGTTFFGNIMAHTSITLTTGTTIPAGRALAQIGSVTLDDNTITGCACP